jgi:hypothetical protein
MIKITSGTAENFVIVVANGMVTRNDYVNVLILAVEAKLKAHKRIRILLQLDKSLSEFAAEAMWDNAKSGFRRLTAFEAIAVVTDVHWIAGAVKTFRYFLGYPVKAFGKDKLAEAKDWLARDNSAGRDERLHRIAFGWYGERNTLTTNSSIPSAGISTPGTNSPFLPILFDKSAQPSGIADHPLS